MWTSHLSYHPRIGYTYAPNFRGRIPHESGGYLIRTNGAGFRSEREFVPARTAGHARLLVFGDSQTAGLGVGNRQRYSDRLETLVPGLEVYNYGLDNTGTDQQYLAYRELGRVEHDLLLIGLYVEDLARVNSAFLPFKDAKGRDVTFAKPYYAMAGGDLVLHHVPVPKRPVPQAERPEAGRASGLFPKAQTAFRRVVPPALRQALKERGVTDLVQRLARFQRVPGYASPRSPAWRLFASVLKMWIAESAAPVLLCPIPMWTFVDGSSDPTPYRTRFREIARETGCHLHDPLDDLLSYPAAERAGFHFRGDKHLSVRGHEALAQSLAPTVNRILAAAEVHRTDQP
jgi:hypothetical protein